MFDTNIILEDNTLTPYYTTNNGVIFANDCMHVMKKMKSECIDLVITSPPYANIKKGVIDSTIYKSIDLENYVDWITNISKEICRILKPTGSFVLNLDSFYNEDKSRNLYVYETVISIVKNTNLKLAQDCFWVKSVAIPSGLATKYKRFRSAVEYLFWFTKDTEKVKTRIENVRLKPSNRTIRALELFNSKGYDVRTMPSGHSVKDKKILEQAIKHGVTPFNYIYCANSSSNDKYLQIARKSGLIHPARFPKDIPNFFIQALTDINDIVLDPFLGSGTTAIVAEQLQRRWIGIEIIEKYCEIFKTYYETCLNTNNNMKDKTLDQYG